MHFSFHPDNASGCGQPERCPHLDGAPLGFLVTLQTSGEESRIQLQRQLDAEKERNSKLVKETLLLEEALAHLRQWCGC